EVQARSQGQEYDTTAGGDFLDSADAGTSGSSVTSVAYNPVNKRQVVVTHGTRVELLTLPIARKPAATSYTADMLWSKHKDFTTCVAFRNDGKLIAAGDGSGRINVYDLTATRNIFGGSGGVMKGLSTLCVLPLMIAHSSIAQERTAKSFNGRCHRIQEQLLKEGPS
ncbi:snoRNA-binding rRNA-processing protein, partial [Perkinsus olseni]